MNIEMLRNQIEKLRKELIDLAERMGFTAMEVVEKSQKLDKVLNEYDRAIQRQSKGPFV
ncbi:aspartyl-phosphate phosphatase Spo0E family protein [Paenibacillus sp. UMB7766-LJ446]|jgi:predicted  nucleic acid-binding Zn-ribbon protein|uniref:Aspartyl-phosphate phosphatase Spo0E family protein n=1 Tax=Paenibacillus urinalis TaxID=521520 RepID=A0AAX3N8Y3_9BACL|nr:MULTISPECIES: aspartyl-phosphate phosphatase Spo0E family protein [Paenibacillaceae]MDK8194729.1 aspartyl-phosphate phosphatase Spo0E family protein [Paenibacillus sp. UMB7766-LJ446]WDH85519.1 aspartyl-phosphate phosphatase Spo0E family protein [Paenibacillus urinalis]SDX85575.1 Spo0E like sporulation regulatory protein [Paenibacillus sp. PDC88]